MTSGPGTKLVSERQAISSAGSLADFTFAVLVELHGLDRLHRCTDGDFARNCPWRLPGGRGRSANSLETSSRPPVMLSNCALAS